MGFKVGWDGLTFFLDQLLILQPLRKFRIGVSGVR